MARGRPSKKSHIVIAACDLFTLQGYQATSIDQVVAAAGVSKPTVYSNFPTKLALWEEVLEHIVSQATPSMTEKRLAFAEQPHSALAAWLAIWESWSSLPENLAVYRIFLGEQHKMNDQLLAKFDLFETLLMSALQAWQGHFKVSSQVFVQMEALSRQYILMPRLLNKPIDNEAFMTAQLNWLLTL
ncbi:TetR/AcrR family transcriptional regulator [Marinomonas sp. THO17]|uniref:TetR/AcrR family transcriptional regulator n=1 Tax=Marinomonas sp. THO17 TaxID=3149048 RepID=UPI00336C0224